MKLLRRIAEFFETRPTYEQLPEPFRSGVPIVETYDFEAVETTYEVWRFATSMQTPWSSNPMPDFKVIESNEYEFDAVRFDAVKKPSRMAYIIYRRKGDK